MAERRNLHVRLSQDAYDGWTTFAAVNGVSLGALVEAFGRSLNKHRTPTTDRGREVVESARQIDAERRSRRSD